MHNDNERMFQLTLLSESIKMNSGFRSDDGMKTLDDAV